MCHGCDVARAGPCRTGVEARVLVVPPAYQVGRIKRSKAPLFLCIALAYCLFVSSRGSNHSHLQSFLPSLTEEVPLVVFLAIHSLPRIPAKHLLVTR